MSTFYSEPPRNISLKIKLENLFGGFANQFGWIFFSFGLIFVWAFTMQSDLTSWYHYRGELIEVWGNVSAVKSTNMSVNKRSVYQYDYSFEDSSGIEHKGSSYSSTSSYSKGSRVLIEFPKNKIELSRIKGMGRNMLGLFGLFPLIFPTIGLVFMFFGIKKGMKSNRLLSIGYFADGKLTGKEATNSRVNNQQVYKFTFSFKDRYGNKQTVTTKTHRTYKLEDESTEKLLYDDRAPNKAVMFDTLNASLKLQNDGTIGSGSFFNLIKIMFIPVISIIGHSVVYYFMYYNKG